MSLNQCTNRKHVEVIVVNNGQPYLDTTFQKSYPNVYFLNELKQGAAHARNTGVLHANGPILIFTDSDCEVAPDFLSKALKAGAAHDLVGGTVKLKTTPLLRLNSIQAFEQVFAFNQRHYIETKGFSVTANLVTNMTTFQKVGPFRADLSEDYDWCQRAKAIGYQLVYQSDLVVSHPCRTSWAQLRGKWKRITAETHVLHRTHGGATSVWIINALLMPISIVTHTPKVFLSPALNTPRERVGAMCTLTRLRLWRMVEMLRLALLHGRVKKAGG